MVQTISFENLDQVVESCNGIVLKRPESDGFSLDSQIIKLIGEIISFSTYLKTQTAEIKDYFSRSNEKRVTTKAGEESHCVTYDYMPFNLKLREYDIFSFRTFDYDISIYFGLKDDMLFDFAKHKKHMEGVYFFSNNSDCRDAHPRKISEFIKNLPELNYYDKSQMFHALNSLPDALLSLKREVFEMYSKYEAKAEEFEISKGFRI